MWFSWLLTVLFAFGVVWHISQIDKPRSPISRSDAIGSLIINGALIYGILHFFK